MYNNMTKSKKSIPLHNTRPPYGRQVFFEGAKRCNEKYKRGPLYDIQPVVQKECPWVLHILRSGPVVEVFRMAVRMCHFTGKNTFRITDTVHSEFTAHWWSPSQTVTNPELWCLPCSQPETVEFPSIWAAITLMWRHYSDIVYKYPTRTDLRELFLRFQMQSSLNTKRQNLLLKMSESCTSVLEYPNMFRLIVTIMEQDMITYMNEVIAERTSNDMCYWSMRGP